MARKEETIKVEDTIEVIENHGDELHDPTPKKDVTFMEGIAPYIVFLEAMRTTKKTIVVAPTDTPKNFFDSIRFYDTGGVRRLYLYVNGDWRYVVLT